MRLLKQLKMRFRSIQEPRINFNDGPCVYNPLGNPDLRIGFYLDGTCHYETIIQADGWAKANLKFKANWTIKINSVDGSYSNYHHFNTHTRNIRINVDSRSLGDTLAWVPQIHAFAKSNPGSAVYISTFWKELSLDKACTNLKFIEPDEDLDNCYAVFNIGFYFDNVTYHHPVDPRTVPLANVASDILGLKYKERRPSLVASSYGKPIAEPYICIATTSTAECKHWLHENAWQQVVDWLAERGLKTVVIQKEPTNLKNVIDRTGDIPIDHRIAELMHCEFFIGLGSGLSWLAWALSKPVVLISGFSKPFAEFTKNCSRVINEKVCHGCWNDVNFAFDRGNWNWCPRHTGTDRQFECSRKISPQMVLKELDSLVQLHQNNLNRLVQI
jgi:autotransporter strand-loop-strand O-heptosyltransferase